MIKIKQILNETDADLKVTFETEQEAVCYEMNTSDKKKIDITESGIDILSEAEQSPKIFFEHEVVSQTSYLFASPQDQDQSVKLSRRFEGNDDTHEVGTVKSSTTDVALTFSTVEGGGFIIIGTTDIAPDN